MIIAVVGLDWRLGGTREAHWELTLRSLLLLL